MNQFYLIEGWVEVIHASLCFMRVWCVWVRVWCVGVGVRVWYVWVRVRVWCFTSLKVGLRSRIQVFVL